MNKSKVEIDRIFISSIDAAKKYVDYNEWTIDQDGEIYQYIIQLFAHNFDATNAKKADYHLEDFIAGIVPEDADSFEAFVDVITEEMHELLKEAYGLSAGSGLFVFATVEEQPVIAFFKLNYQAKFTCEKDEEGKVVWRKDVRLLPSHTQKEYDYFYISPYERKVWMSDMRCMIDGESVDYMAERILQINLNKSEKETVQVIQEAVLDTIRECYQEEAPKKVFEYRQAVAEEAKENGIVNPVRIQETIFADNEKAKERFTERSEDLQIPQKPLYVSPKTQRTLAKKQKIVTKNGIEILVPVEYLEDKNVFDYKQENGMVSIRIHDVNGSLK
ncbi:MAG: nucleoid-associated protein [Lachnospiraceae bacterium]|nr:nucleoid-associated protein [Lachnospiraceae bacterium]